MAGENTSLSNGGCGGQQPIPPTLLSVTPSCDLLYQGTQGTELLPYWTDYLLPKVEDLLPEVLTLEYLCPEHAIKLGEACHMLKVGQFVFNPIDCGLSYTNERGEKVTYFIPQDKFVYNATLCTLTILPAKGEEAITIPTGVPQSEVALGLTPGCDGCSLRFQYKDKICDVPLPNMIIGCTYSLVTNTLTMLHCDGTSKPITLPKASLECNVLDDGTQILMFDNGCPGGTKMFNIPGVKLDIDNLTVVGDQLIFEFGGDGNPSTVTVPLCQIIATHCNATITAEYPDGFDFIDNAGNEFQIRWKNCCTYHGEAIGILDPATPPTTPANNYPNKQDGDTVIECHPNGTSYFTCLNGVWVFDFMKVDAETAPPEVWIGAGAPDKEEGYNTWFNPVTCTLKFCDGADGWLQPSNLVCMEDQPPLEKGGPTLWYKPSTCCFSVLCEGVWLGVNGMVMDAIIQQLCVQVGNTAPVPLAVGPDGKVIIPIPEPEVTIPEYCVILGDGSPIVATPDHDKPNKLNLQLPAYPTLPPARPGCCTYHLGSTAALVPGQGTNIIGAPTDKNNGDTAQQKHPNGFSAWTCVNGGWVLDYVCIFPEAPQIPEYCLQIGNGPLIPAVAAINQEGKLVLNIPAYPTVPDFPKILNCDEGQPATDGSEGIFWMNPVTGCLSALCDGVWKATNGTDIAPQAGATGGGTVTTP